MEAIRYPISQTFLLRQNEIAVVKAGEELPCLLIEAKEPSPGLARPTSTCFDRHM
ncbi:MAG TPA: hypothetical protein P5309_04500 [Syntrophomonadaceae bacterium]|nr:hypothetical protein [Syntrophomonadaceae bacterium]